MTEKGAGTREGELVPTPPQKSSILRAEASLEKTRRGHFLQKSARLLLRFLRPGNFSKRLRQPKK